VKSGPESEYWGIGMYERSPGEYQSCRVGTTASGSCYLTLGHLKLSAVFPVNIVSVNNLDITARRSSCFWSRTVTPLQNLTELEFDIVITTSRCLGSVFRVDRYWSVEELGLLPGSGWWPSELEEMLERFGADGEVSEEHWPNEDGFVNCLPTPLKSRNFEFLITRFEKWECLLHRGSLDRTVTLWRI
jgi:hypothetical protein